MLRCCVLCPCTAHLPPPQRVKDENGDGKVASSGSTPNMSDDSAMVHMNRVRRVAGGQG